MSETTPVESGVEALSGAIRTLRVVFHRLAAIADELHEKAGLTAAHRGVLESLFRDGPQTVPQIARAKAVSRQHIQVLSDALRLGGFVALRPNPQSKRSPVVVLTAKGNRAFTQITTRERGLLIGIAKHLGPRHVADLQGSLAALESALAPLERPEAADG